MNYVTTKSLIMLCFVFLLQEVRKNDPEWKQHLVRYCYDTQCFLMGQSTSFGGSYASGQSDYAW